MMKKMFCVLLALLLLAAQPLALAAEAGTELEEETPAPPAETPVEDASSQPAGDPALQPDPEPQPAPEIVEFPGVVAVPEDPSFFSDEPIISVSVPNNGWVVVNPYGLEVEWEGVTSREQIVSPELVLENQSTVPIQVNAQAVGSIPDGSGAVFAPAPPAPEEAGKAVFLFLEFQQIRDAWSGTFFDAPNQLLVTEAGESKTNLLALDAGREGYFKLSGAAAVNPLSPWTAEDTIKVSVAFTFTRADGVLPSGVS